MAARVEGMAQESKHVLEQTSDPLNRLTTFVRAMMETFFADERSIKMTVSMFHLFLTDAQVFKQYDVIGETMQAIRKTVVDILLNGVSQGSFRPEIARDAEKIAINLMAYLDGIALHYFITKNYF